MARPKIPRTICGYPVATCFKPNNYPMAKLEQVSLSEDEFEALRLVDFLKMQQQEAAIKMGVSRQTLAIILKNARFKLIDCLFSGKALMLNGSTQTNTEAQKCRTRRQNDDSNTND